MDNISTLDQSEKETKAGSASGTSARRRSPRSAGSNTSPEIRLRILQQAIYDCQEAGYTVKVLAIDGGIAIAIIGTRLLNGNIVPIPAAESAKSEPETAKG